MQLVEGDDNMLLLGLHVDTKSDAKVNISGQLRQAYILESMKEGSRWNVSALRNIHFLNLTTI